MAALWAMAAKDLRLLLRDRAGVFLTFAWPLLLASFFGALGPGFGGPRSALAIALVDDDDSAASRAFVAALADDEAVSLETVDDAGAAEASVVAGTHVAYLRVPRGFGERLTAAARSDASATIELGADPRHVAETALLEGLVNATGYAQVAAARGHAPLPVAVDSRAIRSAGASRPPSPYAVTFPQGMLWAVLACAATFGIGLIGERNSGTMLRLFVAPVSRATVLAGKALACALSIVVMQTVLLAVATLGFSVAPLSWPLLLLAIASVTIGFVGVMMLISVLARRSQSAAGISWALLMVMAMLGGGMLPLFLMPEWLQALARVSPVSWGILALEGAIWRGFDLAAMLPPCAALVALGVVSFALGAARVRAD